MRLTLQCRKCLTTRHRLRILLSSHALFAGRQLTRTDVSIKKSELRTQFNKFLNLELDAAQSRWVRKVADIDSAPPTDGAIDTSRAADAARCLSDGLVQYRQFVVNKWTDYVWPHAGPLTDKEKTEFIADAIATMDKAKDAALDQFTGRPKSTPPEKESGSSLIMKTWERERAMLDSELQLRISAPSEESQREVFFTKLSQYRDVIGICIACIGGAAWLYLAFATKESLACVEFILGENIRRVDNERISKELDRDIIVKNARIASINAPNKTIDAASIEETEKLKQEVASERKKKEDSDKIVNEAYQRLLILSKSECKR